MKSSSARSVLAIVAGLATVFILSIGTDFLLQAVGLIDSGSSGVSALWMMGIIILCRAAFNIAGAFVAARLAPTQPMRHALVIGAVGLFLRALSAKGISLDWFPLTLTLLPMPCAWIGGRLGIRGEPLISNDDVSERG